MVLLGPKNFIVATERMIVGESPHEAVHQAAVEGELLVAVSVVLGASIWIAPINAERVRSVGIVREQAGALQTIHARRVVPGTREIAAAVLVGGGVWVGAEVVVKRNIL